MHVPTKVDYAIQAAAELAVAHPGLVKAEQIANAQQIPPKYLQNILTQLRNAGLVESHRGGTEGGYRLARPAWRGAGLLRRLDDIEQFGPDPL
jgi:Rrf2 family protein